MNVRTPPPGAEAQPAPAASPHAPAAPPAQRTNDAAAARGAEPADQLTRITGSDGAPAPRHPPQARPTLRRPDALLVHTAREALTRNLGGDGKLQAPELDRAHAEIEEVLRTSGFSAEEARAGAKTTLLAAMGLAGDGTTAHRLDDNDVVQLAYRFGSPLALHERNLADLLRNQHASAATAPHEVQVRVAIADTNGNGRADRGDVVAVSTPSGTELLTLDQALADHLAISRGIQLAAAQMVDADGKSRFRFAHFPPEVNPAFFEHAAGEKGVPTIFRLREGASASAALDDLVAHAERYGFECNSAIQLAWHLAQLHIYRERYGPQANMRFDEDFAKMALGPDAKTALELRLIDVAQRGASRIIGDHEYFENPAVDAYGYVNGWQGENVVYLGHDASGEAQYFGHPFGVTTEKAIVQHLQDQAQRIDYASAEHNVEVLDRETRARLSELMRGEHGSEHEALRALLLDRLARVADLRAAVRELARAGDPATDAARIYDSVRSQVTLGENRENEVALAGLLQRAEALDQAFDAAGARVLELTHAVVESVRRERVFAPGASVESLEALHRLHARAPTQRVEGTRMHMGTSTRVSPVAAASPR